jgi:PAS domain S-box-containing protein
LEYRLRRQDGEYRWILDHGVPRYSTEGTFSGYIGSCIDISERKLLEMGQKFVLDSSVLMVSSLDYETTLTNVTRRAVPLFADWCAIDLLTPEGELERISVAHVDPEKVKWAYELQKRYPPDLNAETGLANVLRTGKTEFYPEITEAMIEGAARDAEMYEIIMQIGFTSAITVPLIARGRTLGALTFVSAESKRHYTEADVAVAEQIAARAALAVDNARLYHEARAEQERFRVTLSSIGDAVIATDHEGQVTFMNHIAENLTGWQTPEVIGKPLQDVFHIINEHSREVVENPVNRVLREGRIVGLANHTVLIGKTGKKVPIDDSGAPIHATDGEISGVVLVFRDVSERKRAEQRQKFLAEASNLLISSLDYQTTLQNVMQLAVPVIADWGIIYLVRDDDDIQQVAMFHSDPDRLAFREEMLRRYPSKPGQQVGYAKVIRTGVSELLVEITPQTLESMAVDDTHLDMLRQLNLRSSLSVPLKTLDRTFGALSLSISESERALGEEDLALAEELGHVAALAIENARLYRQAKGLAPDQHSD